MNEEARQSWCAPEWWGTYILSIFTETLLHCNMPFNVSKLKMAFKDCILSIIVLL